MKQRTPKGVEKLAKWKPEGLHLHTTYVGNGVALFTVNATNSHYPLGSCWVILTSDDFGRAVCDVVDVYVPAKCRRMGIATYVLTYLLDTYGILKTGTGTKAYGMPLMRKMGFTQNRQTGDWYLRGKAKHLSK